MVLKKRPFLLALPFAISSLVQGLKTHRYLPFSTFIVAMVLHMVLASRNMEACSSGRSSVRYLE